MSDANRHGVGLALSPVLAMQEALTIGLHTLGSDEYAIEELFRRGDALQYANVDRWAKALRAGLLDMLDPSSDEYCQVLTGYPAPWGVAKLPAISLVSEGGGENPSELVIGNVLRVFTELHGPNQEAWETTEIGAGHTTTIEIACWHPAVELAQVLGGAVRWALYQQREALADRGVHELSIRELGDQAAPQMEPRVSIVPTFSVSFNWTYRQSHRQLVPNRVTIERGSFSNS